MTTYTYHCQCEYCGIPVEIDEQQPLDTDEACAGIICDSCAWLEEQGELEEKEAKTE